MEKFKRFLAVIGSIAVSAIGCYLFAEGFNLLFSSHMLANTLGAGFLMMGVYDFVIVGQGALGKDQTGNQLLRPSRKG